MLKLTNEIIPLTFGDEKRHDWLSGELRKLSPGKRILDAGAGPCKYQNLCSHLDYVSQDFSEYDGKGNGLGVQRGEWDVAHIDILCDIVNIPEPDSSFDAVLCVSVLEHLPNPVMALKEFFRLLKPGGKLLLTAPFSSSTHFAPFHYYSGFTRYFYEKHLIDIGFDIEKIHANGNFFQFLQSLLSNIPEFVKHFSRYELEEEDVEAIVTLIRSMEKISKQHVKADELLNFGYEITAYKGESNEV